MGMMFRGQRYMTRGIREEVDIQLQISLWRMIENLKCEVDYLQIFQIEQLSNNQIRITHSQEEPEYKSVTVQSGSIKSDQIKIYVIDDIEHSTMLLASEY